MTQDVYNKINEYCTSKFDGVLVPAERDYVLRTFLDSYYAAVDEQTKANQPLTQEQEETILKSLLTEKIMSEKIALSQKYYKELKDSLKADFEKEQSKSSFFKDVGVNLVSNLIYSIALILLFVVAEDQLSSWLSQLIT